MIHGGSQRFEHDLATEQQEIGALNDLPQQPLNQHSQSFSTAVIIFPVATSQPHHGLNGL